MYDFGFIDKDQLLSSLSKPITIKSRKSKLTTPYFSEEIYKILTQYISQDDFFKGGYNIVTTMDRKIQHIAQKSLEDGIIAYTKKQKWQNHLNSSNLVEIEKQLPKTINKIIPIVIRKIENNNVFGEDTKQNSIAIKTNIPLKIGDSILVRLLEDGAYELYQQPDVTGGIIVMDADTGDILAMSGGYSFDISSFNCTTQAYRQPGSAIKPFIYAAALEEGMNEYDEIEDKAITIKIGPNEYYSPRNYSKRTYGRMPLRDGLIYSRNLATINLVQKIGYRPIKNLLRELGLIDNKFNISYILGAKEVTLLDLASAFSIITNRGKMVYPRFIKEISQQTPSEISFKDKVCGIRKSKKIISTETAVTIKNILRDTTKYGTAKSLSKMAEEFGVDIGGKTGTTNDFKDAWFIGYLSKGSQTLIIGVFIGYKIPKSLGEHASGARIALPIFHEFVKEFCKN